MNQQKDDTTTRQVQEQPIEEGDNQWILGSPMTTSKMENQSVLTATSTAIWQRSAKQRRKNERQELVSNVTKKDT